MKKRLLTFLFLFLISVQAMAFVPFLWTIGTLMAETSLGVQVSAAFVVVGGALYSLAVSRSDDAGHNRTDTMYQSNTPRPPSTVEAAAGFTAGYPHVAPPMAGAAPITYYYPGSLSLTTIRALTNHDACTQYVTLIGKTWASDFAGQCNWFSYGTSGGTSYIGMYTINICAAGYVLSGSNCVLSVPDSVARPTDGFCPILRVGNSYSVDTTDPDCADTSNTPQFAPDGSYSISSKDGKYITSRLTSSGDRVTTNGTPDPATSQTKIVELTTRQTTDPTIPPTVIGKKEGIIDGIGAPADPLPVVTPAPAVTVDLSAVTAAIAVQTAADAAARAADTDAAAAATTAAAGNLTGSENTRAAADASTLAGMNTLANAAKSGYDTDKISLSNIFTFAPVPSVCSPYSKTVHGRTVTIDTCYYTEMIRTTLAWLFALFGAYTTFTNFFRPRT
jgi:hypothetical protein